MTTITIDLLDEVLGLNKYNEHKWDATVSATGVAVISEATNMQIDFTQFRQKYGWDTNPNKFGRLSKRLRRYANDIGHDLSDNTISVACERALAYSGTGDTVNFKLVDRFEWSAGDYGDDGSCYWGGYRIARPKITAKNGRALLTYERNILTGKLARRGRCFILPVEPVDVFDGDDFYGIVIFNGYGSIGTQSASARNFAAFIEGVLNDNGIPTYLTKCDDFSADDVYVNSSVGYIISDKRYDRSGLYLSTPNVGYTKVNRLLTKKGEFEYLSDNHYCLPADMDWIKHVSIDGTVVRLEGKRVIGYRRCKGNCTGSHGYEKYLTTEQANEHLGYCAQCFHEHYVHPMLDPLGREYLRKDWATEVAVAQWVDDRWMMSTGYVHNNIGAACTCPGCNTEYTPVHANALIAEGSVACGDCTFVATHLTAAMDNTLGEHPAELDEWIASRILPPIEEGS